MFNKGLQTGLLFLYFFISMSIYLAAEKNNILYPADFQKGNIYPCLLVYLPYPSAEIKKAAEDSGRVIISLTALNPDHQDLWKTIQDPCINTKKVSCIAEGSAGLKFVLRNPLFFADAVILFSPEEENKIIALLRDDPVAGGNIKQENIYLVPKEKSYSPGPQLQKLIAEKKYPVRIKNASGLSALADLCDDTRAAGIDSLDFFVDDPHYNQCAWLKVYYPQTGPADISAELGDNEILLYSNRIDSFGLDLSRPEFEDWDENFTVKLNYNTVYYGKKPQNKKLYIYNSVETSLIEKPFILPGDLNEKITAVKPGPEKFPEAPAQAQKPLAQPPVKKQTNFNLPPAEPALNTAIRSRTEPDTFTPGQGNVKINFENISPAEIKEWKVDIVLPDQELFKQFKGKDDFKNQISWDGKNESGESLPNGMDCTYQLKYLGRNNQFNKTKPFLLKTGLQITREAKKLSIEMQEVLFNINSAKLSAEAKNILAKVEQVIEQNRTDIREIIIEGHTDNSGNRQFNLRLSEKRAESVLQFIRENSGINERSFRSLGLGDTRPAYANDTPENRKKNRRVTITINLK